MRKDKQKLALILFVVLANFWIWRVATQSFLLALVLALLTIFLVFRLKIVSLILIIIVGAFLVKTNFDTNLKYLSPLEKDKLSDRHEYYASNLGRAYKNRIGLYLHYEFLPFVSKWQKNLADNLDPNLYFFAGHPRERLEVEEFQKFSFVFLPFFIIGIAILFQKKFNFLITYFILTQLVSAFVFPGYFLGPILVFPFISVVVYLGLAKTFEKL